MAECNITPTLRRNVFLKPGCTYLYCNSYAYSMTLQLYSIKLIISDVPFCHCTLDMEVQKHPLSEVQRLLPLF